MLIKPLGDMQEVDCLRAIVLALYSNQATSTAAGLPVFITDISNAEYETVGAGVTGQTLGGAGATGDFLSGLLVTPGTTSPGNVIILDGATSITVFTGGATSVSNLVPFFIPVGAKSVSGAWKVTTGANVTVVAVGNWN